MTDQSRESKIVSTFVTLADTLITGFDIVELLHTLVVECTELVGSEAGGLMLADSSGELQLVASTSEAAELVEIMQLGAGSGPCIECFTSGKPVVVDDIDSFASQWPLFQKAALQQGFRSANCTPLRLRGQIIGTMNLFGSTVGAMREADIALAQALSDVATIGILQERSIRETGIVSEQLR
jgi:GAF domain-containing protein